jgi:hypothetical protein
MTTTRIAMPDFTLVLCPWLDAHGDDPRTFARDGFCDACGKTGHKLDMTGR